MKKVELDRLKPERVIIEAKIEANYPFTSGLVANITKNLIKNGLLKPDQEYVQKFLNVVTNAIDEVIENFEQEDNNETKH